MIAFGHETNSYNERCLVLCAVCMRYLQTFRGTMYMYIHGRSFHETTYRDVRKTSCRKVLVQLRAVIVSLWIIIYTNVLKQQYITWHPTRFALESKCSRTPLQWAYNATVTRRCYLRWTMHTQGRLTFSGRATLLQQISNTRLYVSMTARVFIESSGLLVRKMLLLRILIPLVQPSRYCMWPSRSWWQVVCQLGQGFWEVAF